MNCQEFTLFIIELARGQMLEAASREGAMRHAEACQACAARLAEERSLNMALRAFASSLSESHAPSRVEANLLAAFHQKHASGRKAQAATTLLPFPPAKTTGASRSSNRWPQRIAVAAAIAASLVLIAFAGWRMQFTNTVSPQIVEMRDKQTSDPQSPQPGSESTSLPALAVTTGRAAGDQRRRSIVTSLPRRMTPNAAVKASRNSSPKMITVGGVIDGGNAVFEAGEGETALKADNEAARTAATESVTDFMPLTVGAPAPPLESGQLVRVELPRSALASLGLPVNVERAHEPLKADVLLGGDGQARAIRFVR
jgi:hypothetical protein